MKKTILLLTLSFVLLLLSACGSSEESEESAPLSEDKLVIGVTAGPHEEILEVAAEVAAEDGLEIEMQVFSDYVLPNTALDQGDLDLNIYQHAPFMEQFNEDHGTNLVAVGETILAPLGIYSEKYQSLDEISDGALFGMPNDPVNGSRALLILEREGIIELAEGVEENATINDVTSNPKNLEFIELEAAQIPKQLGEVDFAAINTNYALSAGINPKEDSLTIESTDSPYVNYIVAREENANDPVVEKFVNAYQSDRVKEFIEEEYEGSMLPGWE